MTVTASASPWSDLAGSPDTVRLMVALRSGLGHCADGSWLIDGLSVSKVRRSSSLRRHPHPISMCIDLQLREAASGRTVKQRFFAKAYRGGASAQARLDIDAAHLEQPDFGPALLHLPDLDMLAWAWPNDPGLPQLVHLTDSARVGAHLPTRLVPAGVSHVEVLRYEPERRATLRCTLAPEHPDGPSRTVYAKTFADDQAHRLLHRFERMRAASADPDAACVAEPLGVDPVTATFWQQPAPGQALVTDQTVHAADDVFHRIGVALARLHATDLDAQELRSTDFWLAEAQRRVRKIGRAQPDLAARAAAVAAALGDAAERLPAPALTLIHGDFHPEQVWVAGDRIVFFDFDEFALGNPMEDLAEFIVKLEQLRVPAARAEAQVHSLTAGYRRAAPQHFHAGWLHWYRALQTLLQASRAFVFQVPGWHDLLVARLQRCEQLVNALRGEVLA